MTAAPEPKTYLALFAFIRHLIWWWLTKEMGQSLLAMSLAVQLIIWLILGSIEPQESPPYVPKRKRKPPCNTQFSLQTLFMKCTTTIMTRIGNMKVRRNSWTLGLRYSGYRHRRKKRKLVHHPLLTGMPSTWDSSHL